MRPFRLFLLLLPFFLIAKPFETFHPSAYKLGWDIHMSPFAGGEDILFTHRSIERLEGYFLSKSSLPYSPRAAAKFWRLSELCFGYLPLNYFAVVLQHEVFGHGYRVRDINRGRAYVTGYDFGTPIPYGAGGGATFYQISNQLTTTEDSSIAMAGVESTAVLANLTKFKWLEASFIDPRQTVLYLLSQHDLNLYIGTLDVVNDDELDGHDIHAYIKSVNQTYTKSSLQASTLQDLSWINLADPFTFYSLYAWLRYVVSGKETTIPMIPIYGYGYLPNLRLGLTPFGPEIFLENFLSKEKNANYFYFKMGSHAKNRYAGLGIYAPTLFQLKRWKFGIRFDGWRQPKLLLTEGNIPILDIDFDTTPDKDHPLYPYSKQHEMKWGSAGSILISYQGKSGGQIELGYKSMGFLPGYSLRASPTVRLFYTLLF